MLSVSLMAGGVVGEAVVIVSGDISGVIAAVGVGVGDVVGKNVFA